MLYVPNYQNNQCAVVRDSQTLRVYDSKPQANNQSYSFTDYYYNSHYISNRGYETFGNWNTNLPSCIENENITTAFMYRNDVHDIMFTWVLLCFVIGYPVFILLKRLLKGRRFYE